MNQNSNTKTKPIFRWAGGKRWLIRHIRQLELPRYNNYHEPFFGGGSVFFHLNPKNVSFLSDINQELIIAYKEIKRNPTRLLAEVNSFKICREEYDKIRKINGGNQIGRATRFMYLNKHSYNGVYRVNRNGEYNVPYGKRKLINPYYDLNELKLVKRSLKYSVLQVRDFFDSLDNVKKHDLVFLDPPYTVTHTKNGFIGYNEKIFSWNDQERLSKYVKAVKQKKAFYILTNAKHHSISNLFSNFDKPITLSRYSSIGGHNAKRGRFQEYIFSNLDLGGLNGN
ncbi:MAG: Dam family site-specific DNA-(adenine-N6)-methyltransferase [candidate division Zixibacteria bacterium]|nr:Dam family site-specific DNA-(adenine-N6)-methyltransferase [candidate division Zixibacteria bacterium]